MKKLIYIILAVVVLSSCKKSDIQPDSITTPTTYYKHIIEFKGLEQFYDVYGNQQVFYEIDTITDTFLYNQIANDTTLQGWTYRRQGILQDSVYNIHKNDYKFRNLTVISLIDKLH